LYRTGTQTVFGEGRADSAAVFVGEQPGDAEDQTGHPFVGPAGKFLDEVLQEVGIDRREIYVTNAVKHFKWQPRGTWRIHAKPSAREMAACRPWLMAELEVIRPSMVICLGATAAQQLMGKQFHITQDRGKVFENTPFAPWWMATFHPSAILRMPDADSRRRAREVFVSDLAQVADKMRALH